MVTYFEYEMTYLILSAFGASEHMMLLSFLVLAAKIMSSACKYPFSVVFFHWQDPNGGYGGGPGQASL